MSQLTGVCKFFNTQKGFGFIKESGTENEYFVHITGCVDEIRENDQVAFELKEGKKGLISTNVRLVN